MLWGGERLMPDTHATGPFQDKMEFFGADMFVERTGSIRGVLPESSTQILTLRPFQVVGIWNLHEVRRSPMQILGLDQKITINGFHICGRIGNSCRVNPIRLAPAMRSLRP